MQFHHSGNYQSIFKSFAKYTVPDSASVLGTLPDANFWTALLRLRIYLKQSGVIELEQIKHPSEGGKVNKNYAMVTRNAKLSPASPHESNCASAPTYGL